MKSLAHTRNSGNNTPNRRVLLYARKSTESEDRQVQSIGDQIRLCEEYAKREGLEIVEVIEESKSAKAHGAREGFGKLLSRIEKGEADALLCWHPDRLARNAIDGGWILDLLDRGKLSSLHFVSYTFENSPEGKFMLGMIFSQSKYYVDKLSKDVRRGMQSKRDKGWWPHRAPEGYVNNLADKTIEADPLRFPLLRQAVDLVLKEKCTPARVWRVLNEDWGYRTRPRKKGGGGPLSRTTFYDMLRSPFYCGICEEGGQQYAGSHPKLLSVSEWEKLQTLIHRKEVPRYTRNRWAFTGFIRCGRCDCLVTASRAKGNVYLHCTNGKKTCDKRGVREELLIEQIELQLAALTFPESLLPLLLSSAERHFATHCVTDLERHRGREAARELLEKQLQTLLTLRLRDLVDDAEYKMQKDVLTTELRQLTQEQGAMDNAVEKAMEVCEAVLSYAVQAEEAFKTGTPEERRRIAEMLCPRYTLMDGKLLWEPHPYLVVVQKAAAEIRTFKPLENGSGSKKDGSCEPSVPLGWADRTIAELTYSITLETLQDFETFVPLLAWINSPSTVLPRTAYGRS